THPLAARDAPIDTPHHADSHQTGPYPADATIPVAQNPAANRDKHSFPTRRSSDLGEKLNYTITVQNTGNQTLTGVTVTDPNADAGSIKYVSGDANSNSQLDVVETWSYTAQHTLTQAEIDTNGGGDGALHTIAPPHP